MRRRAARGSLGSKVGPTPPFLPSAGPFAILGKISINSLPNISVGPSDNFPSTRRITPAKYNAVTMNGATWTVNQAMDACAFLWCYTLSITNVSNLNNNAENGLDWNGDDPGMNGGNGASGGGGGGSDSLRSGGDGGGGDRGQNGSPGIGAGGSGGSGVANNWLLDGYSYLTNNGTFASGGFSSSGGNGGRGFGGGGGGADGSTGSGGGSGGAGAGNIQVVCHDLSADSSGGFLCSGGADGNSEEGQPAGIGGGGVIQIYAVHYSGGLNGWIQTDGSSITGSFQIYQINSDNSLTPKTTLDTW